ncbi:transmembrane sensor [Novosphingobium sp. SG751A]|uniref:FecR family protein n=1 Tax=Novosphingobium sp. SG751A TaxID=2587000 RepID=UPI0015525217|nr:FecR domain-containing protein [Novosphingobium sp. SG751A]NOW48653.1 transmembrane sensor [Novosphingobium sp. SG751A]
MTTPTALPVSSSQQRHAIEEEAARLFHLARGSGCDGGSAEAWEQVSRWIELSPAHGVAFAKVEASWDMTEALRASQEDLLADGPGAAVDDVDDETKPAHRLSRRAFGALAAGSGLAVAASVVLWRMGTAQRYSTKVGEERLIHLADGSQVRLNTDTMMDVSMQADRRTVHFLKGEARFDVAHDPARPFLVTARDGAVQALNTVFNLRLRKDFTELTVIEGQAAIMGDGAPAATVPAGTSAMIRATTVSMIKLARVDLERRTAWQEGKIQLDGATLAQAVDEFNRYRTKPLVIGDPDLYGLRMGGMFAANNSADFVDALKQSFGIRVMEGNDGAVILLPGADRPEDVNKPGNSAI